MDILVLYYSFSGRTRAVAEALASELGADLRAIECPAYKRWYGPLAMLWDIATGHLPRIQPLGSPGSYYDLIVVGGPVWATGAAPPVMRVLDRCGQHFKRAGLFVTSPANRRKSWSDDAIAEMSRSLGARTVPTRIFRELDTQPEARAAAVAGFVAQLQEIRVGGGATRADPRNPGWAPIHWPSVRAPAPSSQASASNSRLPPPRDPTSGPLHST